MSKRGATPALYAWTRYHEKQIDRLSQDSRILRITGETCESCGQPAGIVTPTRDGLQIVCPGCTED